MASPAVKRMSLAEFLEWDDGTDMRYELIDGRGGGEPEGGRAV